MHRRNNVTTNTGFVVTEIVLSMAIFLVLMSAVFQYTGSLFGSSDGDTPQSANIFLNRMDMFRYGEPVCDIATDVQIDRQIDLSNIISTSTPITSVHYLGGTTFILTTDSASTSDVDLLKVELKDNVAQVMESKDVGPGVQDSVLLYPFLYIANTSVNSHVKMFSIDSVFIELFNMRIQNLSQSGAMPRQLSLFGNKLILGTEKSNTSGELFVIPITINGALSDSISSLELGGQAHMSRVVGTDLFTANSADPEMRVFDVNMNQVRDYDAPLTLGNGKSVLGLYPYVVLGRTLGSGELTLLDTSTTTITAVDTARTNGSVDYLQPTDNPNFFMALTSNADKEIQFWKISDNARLDFVNSINLPGRVTSYTCVTHSIYVTMLVNEKPTLAILK